MHGLFFPPVFLVLGLIPSFRFRWGMCGLANERVYLGIFFPLLLSYTTWKGLGLSLISDPEKLKRKHLRCCRPTGCRCGRGVIWFGLKEVFPSHLRSLCVWLCTRDPLIDPHSGRSSFVRGDSFPLTSDMADRRCVMSKVDISSCSLTLSPIYRTLLPSTSVVEHLWNLNVKCLFLADFSRYVHSGNDCGMWNMFADSVNHCSHNSYCQNESDSNDFFNTCPPCYQYPTSIPHDPSIIT